MATEDTTSLLAQLRDIHLPDAPAEPSIWLSIAALLLLVCALMIFFLKSRYRKPSWSDEAIRELDNINKIQPHHSIATVQSTAKLLKRIVLTHNTSVSHQNGDEWLHSLDNFFNTSYFTCGEGQIFGDHLYTHKPVVPKTLHQDIKKLIHQRKRIS